jgi:hypothetical protein
MEDESYAGRGSQAASDMKARIAMMTARGYSMDTIIETLWRRHVLASMDGYRYEHASSAELL